MKFITIIPARYQSHRLPGKPLIDIHGKPMIQWVTEQASRSKAERVVVATDDERIAKVVEDFGGEVCMTSKNHPSGTDRLQEVCSILSLSEDEVIVNVQGDEPLMPASVINQVASNLVDSGMDMATLWEKIGDVEDLLDPNIVKVVTDHQSRAIYFSRAAIPYPRDEFSSEGRKLLSAMSYKRHLGIYAYRVSLLNRYVNWQPTPLEQTEKLEQLRALWHGVDIHIAEAIESIPPGIDTEKDLQRTLAALSKS
ncbi:MAG: 3-deoxy-manno-octulosonate cytidylyltransferase [Pseudomonadales bacterium]|jgi:3-deoxy-manno-octulosonate cytidylyltransferase (CMP-KDO synthetase)